MIPTTLAEAAALIAERVQSSQFRRRYARIARMTDAGSALRAYQISLLDALADGEFTAEERAALLELPETLRRTTTVSITVSVAEREKIDQMRGDLGVAEFCRRKIFGE